MAWYPLPYARRDARMPFERPRRATVNLLRMLRLRRRDPGSRPGPGSRDDALRAFRAVEAN
jgi:hypothetical protein